MVEITFKVQEGWQWECWECLKLGFNACLWDLQT